MTSEPHDEQEAEEGDDLELDDHFRMADEQFSNVGGADILGVQYVEHFDDNEDEHIVIDLE